MTATIATMAAAVEPVREWTTMASSPAPSSGVHAIIARGAALLQKGSGDSLVDGRGTRIESSMPRAHPTRETPRSHGNSGMSPTSGDLFGSMTKWATRPNKIKPATIAPWITRTVCGVGGVCPGPVMRDSPLSSTSEASRRSDHRKGMSSIARCDRGSSPVTRTLQFEIVSQLSGTLSHGNIELAFFRGSILSLKYSVRPASLPSTTIRVTLPTTGVEE